MTLYRFSLSGRDHDPGYVVAASYAQAEALIGGQYPFTRITRIEVVSGRAILPDAENPAEGGKEGA